MPFDFADYKSKVNGLTDEQLQREWENYTRQVAGGSTSTAISVGLSPFTAGISLIGLGLSAPRIHNARKKRAIIEAGLQARGTTHNTRKRDIAAPMAVSGVLGGLTFGLAGPGADLIAGEAVGKGFEYAVAHAALDGTGAVIEHTHTEHSKKKAEHKAQLQYAKFQQQYAKEHGMVQGQPQMYPGYQPVPPGAPQYQTQVPGQEPVYEAVPIPAAHRHSIASFPTPSPIQQEQFSQPLAQPQIAFQPASHQQQLPQGVTPPQAYCYPPPMQRGDTPPALDLQQQQVQSPPPQNEWTFQEPKQLQSASGFSAQAGPIETSYFPEKSPAYVASIPLLGQDQSRYSDSTPCETPAPAYSEPASGEETPTDEKGSALPTMTMEEEIEFLKFRLLQMELERRGQSLEVPPLNIVKPVSQVTVTEVTEEIVINEKVAPTDQDVQSAPVAATQPQIPEESQALQSPVAQETQTQIQQPQPQHPQHQLPQPQESQVQPQMTVTPPVGQQQQINYPPPAPVPAPQRTPSLSVAAQYTPPPTSSPLPQRTPSLIAPTQYAPPMPSRTPSISTLTQYAPPPVCQQQNYQPAPNTTYQPTPNTSYQPQPQPQPQQPQYQQPQYQQPQYQPPTPSSYQPPAAPVSVPTPSPYSYNPQNYPPPPSTQPPYARHDSGYYSGLSTPQPQSQISSHQPTPTPSMHHFRSQSVASFVSPTSPPPPYFPPPPGQAVVGGGGKDYFGPPQPQAPLYGQPQQPAQQWQKGQGYGLPPQVYQGTQGWQWGMPNPVGVGQGQKVGEPNYGPPPAVPQAWRGS